MNAIMDFLIGALPWVAIGFLVASLAVKKQMEKEGLTDTMRYQFLMSTPSLCCIFLALLEYADKDVKNGTTWLVLAVVIFVLYRTNNANKK